MDVEKVINEIATATASALDKQGVSPDDCIVCTIVWDAETGQTVQASSQPSPALASVLYSVAIETAAQCGLSEDDLRSLIAEAKQTFNERN